ncbi:MAG: multidrug DMT transporter [Desulfovibrio sp. MES5]|nr:MAG: multidrug DMT transporter [Desulfovibrio sp. MES5]
MDRFMQKTVTGYSCALLAVVIWSGNFVVARAVAGLIPPWQCNFWRWLIALIILLPFAKRHWHTDWPAIKKNWRGLSLLGILGVTLLNTLIYKAGQTTESINMALLVPTAPIVILILSRVLYGEPISPRRMAGVLVVLVGVATLVSRGDWDRLAHLRFNEGDLWALGGVLSFGLYSLFIRQRSPDISPIGFSVTTFALGLLYSLPFTAIEAVMLPTPHLSTPLVIGVLYTGIGCSALSFWLWTVAIDYIGPVRAGMVYYSLPVFAGIAAMLILGEIVTPAQMVGGALVITGIIVATVVMPQRHKTDLMQQRP